MRAAAARHCRIVDGDRGGGALRRTDPSAAEERSPSRVAALDGRAFRPAGPLTSACVAVELSPAVAGTTRVSGVAQRVPWARDCDAVVVGIVLAATHHRSRALAPRPRPTIDCRAHRSYRRQLRL